MPESVEHKVSISRKYYYYRRPNGELLVTLQRPTCLIGDPSKTFPCFIIERHASSKTDMTDRDPLETDMPVDTHQKLTCLWSPIGDQHACGV